MAELKLTNRYKNSDIQELYQEIVARFGKDRAVFRDAQFQPSIEVHPEMILDVMKFLVSESKTKIDFLDSITGTDLMQIEGLPELDRSTVSWSSLYPAPISGESGEVKPRFFLITYHLMSFTNGYSYTIKVVLPENRLSVASVDSVFGVANWLEREIFDLLGIQFVGSHDLRRLMLPEDWIGFPLRRDYQQQAVYQGMSTNRPDPIVELRELSLKK